MSSFARNARLSMESLETRETPAGTSLASTTDLILDSYNPTSYPGSGVYRSMDAGKTWTFAPETNSGRITGIAVDPAPKADPLPVLLVIADRQDFSPVSPVDDLVAGGGDPGVAAGGTIPVYWHVIRHGAGSTAEAGITKFGSQRLTLQGDGTYTGATEGETITIGGSQVETHNLPRPTIVLQRLANPGAAPDGTSGQSTSAGNYSAVVFVGGWGSSGI